MVKMKCTDASDGEFVMVGFSDPVDGLIEKGTILEVLGTVESKNKITSIQKYLFPQELAKDFDTELYNELLSTLEENPEWSEFNVEENCGSHSPDDADLVIEDPAILALQGQSAEQTANEEQNTEFFGQL